MRILDLVLTKDMRDISQLHRRSILLLDDASGLEITNRRPGERAIAIRRRLPRAGPLLRQPQSDPDEQSNEQKDDEYDGEDARHIHGHSPTTVIGWIEKGIRVESLRSVGEVGQGQVEHEDDEQR